MQTVLATVSEEGQVTLPEQVRRQLGISARTTIAFVLADSGEVTVRASASPDLEALAGAAGSLPQPLTDQAIEAIVAEERALAYLAKVAPATRKP